MAWWESVLYQPYELDSTCNSITVDSVAYSINTGLYENILAILSALAAETGLTCQVGIDNYVSISGGGTFTMAKGGDSLLTLLGFSESSYSGDDSYSAENYSGLWWKPNVPLHSSSSVKEQRRSGFLSVSDSGAFLQKLSENIHEGYSPIFSGISEENKDWYESFWELYSGLGLQFYENISGDYVYCVLVDDDAKMNQPEKLQPEAALLYQIKLNLRKVTEVTYDYTY